MSLSFRFRPLVSSFTRMFVEVHIDNAVHDLGLMTGEECDSLAATLRDAAEDLSPQPDSEVDLVEILTKAREFAETVHDGEYGYSDCTRDELVDQMNAVLSKRGA